MKRYEVIAFPYDKVRPIMTDYFLIAWIAFIFRYFKYIEVKIVDHKTENRYSNSMWKELVKPHSNCKCCGVEIKDNGVGLFPFGFGFCNKCREDILR